MESKTAGRKRLERLVPLEQLARASASKGTSGENRAVCCEKSGMANPRAFKFVCERRARGRAVRGGIDAASVARSQMARIAGCEVARSIRPVSARLESASQFSAKLWDALSKWGGLRKLHPRILPWNGCAFRTGVQKETASRFDVGTANKSRTVIWRGLEFA